MKLKTTKVFVPVSSGGVEIEYMSNGFIDRIEEKELFCHTKEELISIISDAFRSGEKFGIGYMKSEATYNPITGNQKDNEAINQQKYINQILE